MKTLLILIVVTGLLVATNPRPDDYADFLRQQMAGAAAQEGEMAQALVSVFGGVAGSVLANATTRDNYVLFSIYQTDLGASETVVLGILGNFLVLRSER